MQTKGILIYTLILSGFLFSLLSNCKKEDKKQVPVLKISTITNITLTTATCVCNIISDGGETVTARGVCWSKGKDPDITDSINTDSTGTVNYTSILTGLSPNTTYFVRAYATNSIGTGYDSAVSFTTAIVADTDGNGYHIVTIGSQVWMVENLKVTHYRNGDPIPNIMDNTQWSNLTTGAFCDFSNTPGYSTIYGKLYNWYTVHDSRNMAPVGWHVPNDADWTVLITYLGGGSIAGGKLKESGFTHWQSPNTGATNESGFTALPGGKRDSRGTFNAITQTGLWWSSTENFPYYVWTLWLSSGTGDVIRFGMSSKADGYSVRCLKD